MTTTTSTINYNGVTCISHSYPESAYNISTFGSGRKICYGDKLFARLVMKGRTILEFMISQVNDFTELISELRRNCKEFKGLARLYLRNVSRGWSMERPLMLYQDTSVIKQPSHNKMQMDSASRVAQYMIKDRNGEVRQVSFPWDL